MTETGTIYCLCEAPAIEVEHDAGCRRCGLPVNFAPPAPNLTPDQIAELEQAAGFEEWEA